MKAEEKRLQSIYNTDRITENVAYVQTVDQFLRARAEQELGALYSVLRALIT